MRSDSRRRASLDGVWDFLPGDHDLADLDHVVPEPIRVPGLREAEGWLDLDGVAWCRRTFDLADASGYWTLRFDAVIDPCSTSSAWGRPPAGWFEPPCTWPTTAPHLGDVTVEAVLGDASSIVRLGSVAGWATSRFEPVEVAAPEVLGGHGLVVRLLDSGHPVAENRYPIPIVAAPSPLADGAMVVAEGGLDVTTGVEVRARLGRGEAVVILAQRAEAAAHDPVPVEMEALTSVWGLPPSGSPPTTGRSPASPATPSWWPRPSRCSRSGWCRASTAPPFPDTPVVMAWKPVPGAMTGTVLGSHAVGPGRLVFCQYRLGDAGDDDAAGALRADPLRWATSSRPVMHRDEQVKDDGRRLIAYSWAAELAR